MTVQAEVAPLWEPSETTGFLPSEVPGSPDDVAALPHPAMIIMGTASRKAGLLSDQEVEDVVAELESHPTFDYDGAPPSLLEAILRTYVSFAAHLIHRPSFAPRRELPAVIARPLWDLSRAVGRPPSLTYASYVLSNFTKPITSRTPAEGLTIGQTPSSTEAENWFVAVHLAVESVGGEIVAAVKQLDRGLAAEDHSTILAGVEAIDSCLSFATETMPTVRERLDPVTFRDKIRPLLYGHAEIKFRGVEHEPRVAYIGETGAQSGVIRAADAALGTKHTPAMTTSMNRFVACAPPAHRRYLGRAAAIGERFARARLPLDVGEARRRALQKLALFRRTHLKVVMEYLAPEGTSLAERGTGGTHFQLWLQRLIDETEETARTF